MGYKNRVSNKFFGLLLILCISRVCHTQLMCYVCDNCAQVNAQTPQFECNEDFFNASGSTDSSVQTTTEHPKTTAGVTAATDTTKMPDETTTATATSHTEETTMSSTTTSTTEKKSPESTAKTTATENVPETTADTITESTTLKVTETMEESTSSSTTTEQQPPSPPTVGPPKTTTAVPTPPNLGTVKPLDDVERLNNRTVEHEHQHHANKDEVEVVDIEQGTAKPYKPSAEFRVRQLRSVSNVTFHCFKVQATTVNGTMVVYRGCSRVQANESVCGQWETQHANEKINKCSPCSRTKCNGSSAVNVSITTLIVAVVAVLMHRK